VDKKGNIYIRLDKQELYRGRYVLKDSGEVKITVHMQFHPSEGKDAIDHAEEVFGN
jgi:RNA binding exosome subunit